MFSKDISVVAEDPHPYPIVNLRIRGGAGGGNPNRVFLDGSKNAYLDKVVTDPFETKSPVKINEPIRAWIEGGTIPLGKRWVVTRIDYDATTVGDSNGHGEFIVSLKGKKLVKIPEKQAPSQGSWEGRITLSCGDERAAYVEIANSSAATVTFFGHFEEVDGSSR